MKCPYRTIVTETKTATFRVEKDTEFKDCMGRECPFYNTGEIWEGQIISAEACMRIANERKG